MMSGHTPGPWKDDSMLFNAGWRCIVNLPGGRSIDVADPRNRKTDDEDKANAELIASAPDLARKVEELEHLNRQLQWRSSPATQPCECPEFCTYHARARFEQLDLQNRQYRDSLQKLKDHALKEDVRSGTLYAIASAALAIGDIVDKRKIGKVEQGSKEEKKSDCDHGITFDHEASKGLDAHEVRKRWPRLDGLCPKGCGYCGIAYASSIHYYSGDW